MDVISNRYEKEIETNCLEKSHRVQRSICSLLAQNLKNEVGMTEVMDFHQLLRLK